MGVYNYLTKQQTAREVFSNIFPGIDDDGIQHLEEGLAQVDTQFLMTLIGDRLLESWDLTAAVEVIRCPVLLLYGEVSKGSVVRDQDIEFFQEYVSKGAAIQIKGTGHLLQVYQPACVLEAIAEFIEKRIG